MATKKIYEEVKHVIEEITLIKVEKKYNSNEKNGYFYNIKVSGIDELLLLATTEILNNSIVGSNIQYKLNKDTGEITDFDIV